MTEAIPSAQRGLDAAGAYIGIGTPPGMPGRHMVYEGLIATAFLHEQPGFRPSPYAPATYDGVLDVVAGAKAELQEQAKERKARRWSPIYWLDGVVRVLLSIPAYIVSRVAGTSVAKINKSAWGFPLRVLAVIADLLAVYFGGRAFGLWG